MPCPPNPTYRDGIRRTDPSYSLGAILHAVLMMGRDNRGNYLVADPISRKGVARLTRAELASYFAGSRSNATALWR